MSRSAGTVPCIRLRLLSLHAIITDSLFGRIPANASIAACGSVLSGKKDRSHPSLLTSRAVPGPMTAIFIDPGSNFSANNFTPEGDKKNIQSAAGSFSPSLSRKAIPDSASILSESFWASALKKAPGELRLRKRLRPEFFF